MATIQYLIFRTIHFSGIPSGCSGIKALPVYLRGHCMWRVYIDAMIPTDVMRPVS